MKQWSNTIVTDFFLSAPARLHFGLYSAAGSASGSKGFGGVGLMIEQPAAKVACSRDQNFTVSGLNTDLVSKIVDLLAAKSFLPQDPRNLPIRIELLQTPPRHSGLGTGTQIAFAVAATLMHCFGMPMPEPDEMADLVGRGKRSAVGSHGFFSGGFIADSGITPDAKFSPIESRQEFPLEWPIVLIRPGNQTGLHGQQEQTAFDQLGQHGTETGSD